MCSAAILDDEFTTVSKLRAHSNIQPMVPLFIFGTFPKLSKTSRMSSESHTNNPDVTQTRRPIDSWHKTKQSTVILMRHGMTDWNQEGRVQGGLDKSRLNDTGYKQVCRAGLQLGNIPIETVLCSPLRRARDTFEHLAKSSANPDLLATEAELLAELKELQVPWQGHLKSELASGPFMREYLEFRRNPTRFSFNGFNPIRDLAWRAEHVWEWINRRRSSSYLIISHNQTNKALISSALGMPLNLSTWNQGNCSFNVFIADEGGSTRLRLCNGIDLSDPNSVLLRNPRKENFVRLVLHLKGHERGLLYETAKHDISHTYCFKTHSNDTFDIVDHDSFKSPSTVTVPVNLVDAEVYGLCVEVLEDIRTRHSDGYVVVSVMDARIHSALVAACLGLGHEGMQKFHSDPGGVTVVDVKSTTAIGSGVATVECHNNFAYDHRYGGFLKGYTSKTQDAGMDNGPQEVG